uniref:Uncharacterized protein n=1 Tax=uncultured marine virus TaxID=186617 RepID=A0A0F7L8V9_9VIRU|nr:hypothetical protein [uncultured marine virus]
MSSMISTAMHPSRMKSVRCCSLVPICHRRARFNCAEYVSTASWASSLSCASWCPISGGWS